MDRKRLRQMADPATAVLAGRYLANALNIEFNRARGVSFIPQLNHSLRIETSSRCNLKCRFCAYEHKVSPRVTMPGPFFRECVRQGVDMGFRFIDLTPCTGDVFMDRHVFDKFEFLESEPGIDGFYFFTNFTIPEPRDIRRLLGLKKFGGMSISTYGHDLPTFKAITKSTDKVYHRLVANLDELARHLEKRKFPMEISVKSVRNVPRSAVSELMRVIEKFRRAGIRVRISNGLYNNWGGAITERDLNGLDMRLKGSEFTYKNGTCQRLFDTVQIMATGIVNGCACRDAEATLRIGDMRKQSLREILSSRNKTYMQLIDEQERGEFQPICKGCDFYRSIYLGTSGGHFKSVAAFKAGLDERCATAPTNALAESAVQAG